MHHFIFPTQDTWISSGSSTITGESFKDQNFGRDQILEVKKEFFNATFNHQTRALINFSGTEFTEMSKSIVDGSISSNAKYFLRLFEAEGNSEMTEEYTLSANPISESWVEGTGKFGDNPKNTNGCSWKNRSNPLGGTATNWNKTGSFSIGSGSFGTGNIDSDGGPTVITGSGNNANQSFSNESPDVNMDVTDIVNNWLTGSTPSSFNENYGFLLKFSGSQETSSNHFGHLKFFSRNTHTIYSPKLEIRWDDHIACSGSNTGSLTELTMSGLADNFLYMKGLRESYKVGERVKFRVGARKRYVQKTFNTSVQTITGSFISEGSGSYAIKDVATDEFIVPFEDNQDTSYTKLSCDSDSNYFIQYLDGFYPDRVYKILLKLKYDDGQEQVFDDDFEFVVKRK